ncbi:MAG TPA: hypothetical protein VF017_03520 [Thermoanaerobaculia bacterium]|nr:hypothetical protein [Thermoanaerobaculia bacterium]
MSVLTLEGLVENGQIRLLEETPLPEKARVYVVVPVGRDPEPRIWSPRLADPLQASQFVMEVTKSDARATDDEV